MSDASVLILARNVIRSGRVRARLEGAGLAVHESLQAGRDLDLGDDGDTVEVVVVGSDRIDEAWLADYPGVRYVLRAGSGTDNIDVGSLRGRIAVGSFPGLNAESVADYAFGLMLAAARRIPDADKIVRGGEWRIVDGIDLYGKTLGIVGLGAIGRGMARRAAGFGMRVLCRTRTPHSADDVEQVSLDELLGGSDFVSLHVPLTDETVGMIGAAQLAIMRPRAVLVNTSRGAVVDEAALIEALREHRIGGAALDTFEVEPLGDSPLRLLDNVVLSPHSASFGDDAILKTEDAVVEAVLRFLHSSPAASDARKELPTS